MDRRETLERLHAAFFFAGRPRRAMPEDLDEQQVAILRELVERELRSDCGVSDAALAHGKAVLAVGHAIGHGIFHGAEERKGGARG